MVFYRLRRRRAAAPGGGRSRCAGCFWWRPETPLQADHDHRFDQSARVDTDQEEAAQHRGQRTTCWLFRWWTNENRLVGIITVDDVIDIIKDEATEDIYRHGRRVQRR